MNKKLTQITFVKAFTWAESYRRQKVLLLPNCVTSSWVQSWRMKMTTVKLHGVLYQAAIKFTRNCVRVRHIADNSEKIFTSSGIKIGVFKASLCKLTSLIKEKAKIKVSLRRHLSRHCVLSKSNSQSPVSSLKWLSCDLWTSVPSVYLYCVVMGLWNLSFVRRVKY
jgi:hypothetical protein